MAQGSPPRVRGKGAVKIKAQPQAGITPACAGKRLIVTSHNARTWDHPRVCGEKPEFLKSLSQGAGSPPRVRGKEPICISMFCRFGITPACAGKSPLHAFQPAAWGDHPRVCGEKWVILQKYLAGRGSPPRVRGKAPLPNVRLAALDHPRVCGEKLGEKLLDSHVPGSPPRVRGKDPPYSDMQAPSGITPACAGKSSCAMREA